MKMNGERNEIYTSPKQKDKNTRDNYNIKFSSVNTRYDKTKHVAEFWSLDLIWDMKNVYAE